jgi:hypothetical protein
LLLKSSIVISSVLLFLFHYVSAQSTWSLSTDFGALRSLKENQQFWTMGHTIKGEMHVTKKSGPYAWVSYFFRSQFKNNLLAEAKSSATTPSSFSFRNNARMSITEFSLGWKHYLKGSCDNFKTWNLYTTAGFGLIGGKVLNSFDSPVDTSLYKTPLLSGEASFKRLAVDLGLGWELPVTGEIFLYNDWKAWIPASDYPSPYLLSNRYAPLIVSFHMGIRVYFDSY